MTRRPTLALALAAALSAAAGTGSAQVITFDAVPSVGNPILTTLTTQGFTFTSLHFHTIDFQLGVSNGTIFIAEEGGFFGRPITMTAPAPFSLLGLDAGGLFEPDDPSYPDASFVDLRGTLAGGGTLDASFAISTSAFASFALPAAWTNLVSVEFSGRIPGVSANAGFALDNLVVGPSVVTPEPGSVALLATGLAALALGARGSVARRRRAR
jgi:hypothetical protein